MLEWGLMYWFGESWGAPVCDPEKHVGTPVNSVCVECDIPIMDGDTGFQIPVHSRTEFTVAAPYHRVCFLRTVIPCDMWSDEMKQDMPERWRQHFKEKH